MDPHPTPFPGKLRPSATTKKEKGDGKSSREPNRATIVASRHRQNRVFGTVRSTNVTVERPPQEKAKGLKQLKPSGVSKKLPNKDGSKMEHPKEPTGASHENAKVAATKPRKSEAKRCGVRFQDEQRAPEKGGSGKGVPEEAPRTPMSSIKPAELLGTPYHTAVSCSKCRFDKLESAPYWLAQIKLAESVGKHFVSAAFFRLALECNAEPIRSLKSEVKRYMVRHSSLHMLTVWKEVGRDYGLLDEEPSLCVIGFDPVAASPGTKLDPSPVLQQGLSGYCKDGCFGLELGGTPQYDLSKEVSKKNVDFSSVELDSNVGMNPSAVVIGDGASESVTQPTINASEDNLMEEKTDDGNVACHCGNRDSLTVATPEKIVPLEKSERSSSLSPKDSSSTRKKVRPRNHADGRRTTPGKSQTASELCGEGSGKSKDESRRSQKSKEGAKKNQNSQLKSASDVNENSIKVASKLHELDPSEILNAVELGSCYDNQGSQ